MATLALKSVDNPLEFGVVIVDDDGRVERFLEKPSWGQVFSDTINTGVYVLEPEVLRGRAAEGMPYDFSKQLFPDLLERGKPMLGPPPQGYWQDIGNLDQYRQANFDALEGRVRAGAVGDPPARQRAAGGRACSCPTWIRSKAPCTSATSARSTPARGSGRTPCWAPT